MDQIYQPQTAIFAAGCFWGVQYYFDQVPGVLETEVGYIGGDKFDPTYEQVCQHITGHAEAVQIAFNPQVVSYETLLMHFFRMHDPTQHNRQGPDIGDNYRSAIFYTNKSQEKEAESVLILAQTVLKKPIATTLEKATRWWPAEDYHQKFAERTGQGMCHIPYAPIEEQ